MSKCLLLLGLSSREICASRDMYRAAVVVVVRLDLIVDGVLTMWGNNCCSAGVSVVRDSGRIYRGCRLGVNVSGMQNRLR